MNDVPRNVPDDVLRLLPKNGGVVMVTFVPGLPLAEGGCVGQAAGRGNRAAAAAVSHRRSGAQGGARRLDEGNPAPRATVADTADHIDHIRKVAGIDHIGLGGDFDGITSVPEGLEDVSKYPTLTAELLRRGYKDDDIKKILGLNILRVMRAAEKVAREAPVVQASVSPVVGLQLFKADRRQRLTIVALGDSTTAGTPGWKSRVEAPPRRGRRDEPVRLLADAGAP